MQLKLLSINDTAALRDFETKNKAFFEQLVPPRNVSYFTFDSLYKIVKSLIKDQQLSKCHLYLAYDKDKIVGRFNLTDIKQYHAELGYRLCQSVTGKGLATNLTAKLLDIAKHQHNLIQINAHTTTDNPSSVRVLEKTGFKHLRIEPNAVILNGKKLSFTYYKIKLKP